MLSPGEQPRTRPLSLRRVFLLLCLCAGIAGLLLSQAGNLREYKRYFTEARKPASLDISALSEEWTERRLKEHFSGYPVSCYPYRGPLAVQNVCAVEVSSTNGVPTLYMSFFFAGGLLTKPRSTSRGGPIKQPTSTSSHRSDHRPLPSFFPVMGSGCTAGSLATARPSFSIATAP